MTRDELANTMNSVFKECLQLYDEGQKEYARGEDNGFANFDRVAEHLGISREEVLLVYALKHLDGITAYVQGHKSQREDVRGRINDLIVYLCILRGMFDFKEGTDNGTFPWNITWTDTPGDFYISGSGTVTTGDLDE